MAVLENIEGNQLEVVRFSDLPIIAPFRFVGAGVSRGAKIVSGPDEVIDNILEANLEVNSAERLTLEKVARGVGNSLLPRVVETQTNESLALESAERAVADAESRFGIKRSKISKVYLGTSTANRRAPDMSKDLHKELGLGKNSHTLTVNNACQAGLDALYLATSTLSTYHGCGDGNLALVIGTDTVSRFLDPADPDTNFIFSDTSASLVIESEPDMESGIVLQKAFTDSDSLEGFLLGSDTGDTIEMAPRTVMNAILNLLKSGLKETRASGNPYLHKKTLAGENFELDLEELKFVAPHLASEFVIKGMYNILVKAGLDGRKVVNNFFSVGNSSAPTTLLNLVYAMRQYKPETGEHSMSISAAVGSSMMLLAFRH